MVAGPGILHISDFKDRDDQWNDVHVTEIAVHELSNQSAIIHFTHVFTTVSQTAARFLRLSHKWVFCVTVCLFFRAAPAIEASRFIIFD